jgi:hypothetical protein
MAQVGIAQVGTDQPASPEASSYKKGIAQIGASEPSINEIGVIEVGRTRPTRKVVDT